MTDSSQPGGAGNLSGVLYQTLWCLLRALRIRLRDRPDFGDPPEALLVLEPAGGGGDLRVVGDVTEIEQLKSKSDSGTWSLQTVICDVLPDLFLAVTDDARPRRFRFVTEGKMGRWAEVYQFFGRLGNELPDDDILAVLDDEQHLKFQTARRSSTAGRDVGPFFSNPPYSERALFLLIARELRSRPAIAKLSLSDVELHRRLSRLLGAFEFVGNQQRESVQREIDRLLLAVVDRKEEIPKVRDSLALSLLRKAAAGNREITAESLLAEHGLNAIPLVEWSRIRRQSHDELCRRLRQFRYITEFDVRKEAMESVALAWRDSARTLVISGDSGQGKTWSLAAVATAAAADDVPVLWVDATGSAAQDLVSAADQFWLDIRGGETAVPLRQIAARLHSVVPSSRQHRLRVCIDNVLDYNEAATIVRDDWPSRGISVALSCSNDVATSLKEALGDHVDLLPCEDFSWEELHDLLERRLQSAWTTIPDDVRETLRRPLLAAVYCDELFRAEWKHANEYELYAATWRRLSTRQQVASPLDVVLVESLADAVLRGETYPWTLTQLREMGVDNAALGRLERCGWLVRTNDNRVRIFHDRLLNWAVAQALFSAIQSGKRSPNDVITQVAELSKTGGRVGEVVLGYVPMDLLWLLAGEVTLSHQACPQLLEALEPSYGHQPEILYRELAPTLGERIADALFHRYSEFQGYPWVRRAIAEAIAATADDRFPTFAQSLLDHNDPQRQRAGLKLICVASCPQLLDEIWELHVRGLENPTPFLEEGEEDWLFREDSWSALRRSAVHDPEWIVGKIAEADPGTEPVHDLGWLIANLPDGTAAWQKSKAILFDKVASDKDRVLAKCVGLFRDSEYLSWLRERVPDDSQLCSPVALQAISRIEPKQAVEVIDRADLTGLHVTTKWAFSEVWHRRPSEVNVKVMSWASASDDPWEVGLLYRDRVNDIPRELFEMLLRQLEKRLSEHLSEGRKSSGFTLFRELSFISKAVAPTLVDALQAQRGTAFESCLAEYVRRIGPQIGVWHNGLERDPGLTILRRINGAPYTNVVNEFLQCDDRYGRHDALKWAVRRPDETTFQIAAQIIDRDELWERFPLEQNDAMQLLAVHEKWDGAAKGLVRWGLKTVIELTHGRVAPHEFASELNDKLRGEVDQNPTPGDVLALAFIGAASDVERLHSLLESSDIADELAHACVIGLEMLEDDSDRGVHCVAQRLAVGKLRYSATRMLTQAGTPAAWDALWHDLGNQFDHITALNLLNLSQHAEEVLELTLSRLPSQSRFGDWELLRILIRNLRPELKQRLLADRWLRDKFHREAVAGEGRSWIVGSKAASIECLAEFDSDAAFEAARQALQTPDWHDRERYPYILVEIDAGRTVPLLLDHLEDEKAGHVRYAIGRVFAQIDLKSELSPKFEAPNPRTRASACFSAGWARDGVCMTGLLRRSLDDPDEAVIAAAMDAIDRLHNRSICAELVDRANSCDDLVSKWMYIDAIIDVIDPGDEFRPLPSQLREACSNVSRVVRKLISERLKKRRKKLHENLKKARNED